MSAPKIRYNKNMTETEPSSFRYALIENILIFERSGEPWCICLPIQWGRPEDFFLLMIHNSINETNLLRNVLFHIEKATVGGAHLDKHLNTSGGLVTRASFLAEISVSSHQKLFIFII